MKPVYNKFVVIQQFCGSIFSIHLWSWHSLRLFRFRLPTPCRGDMKLGTGCGHCVRCAVFRPAEILHLADQRPHLAVAASDGAHVVPCALVQSVIDGKQPSFVLPEPVVQRIIEEWLQKVSKCSALKQRGCRKAPPRKTHRPTPSAAPRTPRPAATQYRSASANAGGAG